MHEPAGPLVAARAPSAAAWALAGSLAMGAALTWSDGHDHPGALLVALVAVAAWAKAVWRPGVAAALPWSRASAAALVAALASLLFDLLRPPGIYMVPHSGALILACTLGALVVVVATAWVPTPPHISRFRFPILVALAAVAGASLLRASPAPVIDVWEVAQQSARALLAGHSPYATGAIATIDTHTFRRTIDAWAYPPLPVVLAVPFYAIAGDVRWASLAAHLSGAVLVWRLARKSGDSAWADLLGACALFQPRALFVVEQSWAEPFAFPFVAGFALAIVNERRWAALVCLGLLCAVKQHFVLYLPLLAFLPRLGLRGVAVAVGTALATLLPFALWTPVGLVRGLFLHHLENPFRGDSLSVTAVLSDAGLMSPSWLGFVAALATLALAMKVQARLWPRLLASNLVFAAFFLFGRQAFCNYYYLLESVALVAVAAIVQRAPAPVSSPLATPPSAPDFRAA